MFDKRKYRLDGGKIIPFRCPTGKYDCGNCSVYEGCATDSMGEKFVYCAYRLCILEDDRYYR